MSHDVFISYANKDLPIAESVCQALEENSIGCWYAPRDIPAGTEYEEALVDAICSSCLVILILSSHSNDSLHVRREIKFACNEEVQPTILPMKIENVVLNKALKYYLGSNQMLDASTPPLESHLQRLINQLREYLPRPAPTEQATAGPRAAGPPEMPTENLARREDGSIAKAGEELSTEELLRLLRRKLETEKSSDLMDAKHQSALDDVVEQVERVQEEYAYATDLPSSDEQLQEQSPAALRGEDYSMEELIAILNEKFDKKNKEKGKVAMDLARASGLGSLMERLGELVHVQADKPSRSLEEIMRDGGKLNDLMTEMMTRIKKPTFAGPELAEGSRPAKVLELLQERKVFVGAEGMKWQNAESESTTALDLFQRMARLTTSIHQTQGDEQKLVALETNQARALVNEIRLFARRHYITLAEPVWSHGIVPLDPNLIFFAGPDEIREGLEYSVTDRGLSVNRPARLGADLAESRWQDLRAASLAVFDISALSPQVFYELGIALTLGSELLIIAEEGTEAPFDVAQRVHLYSNINELRDFFSSHLEASLYGLQCAGSDGSSLANSVAYAERLAEEVGDTGLTHVALESLRKVADDPVAVGPAIKLLNTFLKKHAQMIIYPRWPGVYPEPDQLRCFIIMPFREELDAIYETIETACGDDIEAVRGDVSDGQQIIESIWEDIGKATHVTVDLTGFNPNVCLELGVADTLGRNTILIAKEGTDKRLKTVFPSIAERRCHTFPTDPSSKPAFMKGLTKFLKKH